MITHIHVYKQLEAILKSQGHTVNATLKPWRSPLIATHPQRGEIEVHFYGENFTFDESSSSFQIHELSRGERLKVWQAEKTMLSEEAGHVCVAKAVLLALTRLVALRGQRRVGLAFPDNHNFRQHLDPILTELAKCGIEIFIICTDLSVAFFDREMFGLPPASGGGLLIEGQNKRLTSFRQRANNARKFPGRSAQRKLSKRPLPTSRGLLRPRTP